MSPTASAPSRPCRRWSPPSDGSTSWRTTRLRALRHGRGGHRTGGPGPVRDQCLRSPLGEPGGAARLPGAGLGSPPADVLPDGGAGSYAHRSAKNPAYDGFRAWLAEHPTAVPPGQPGATGPIILGSSTWTSRRCASCSATDPWNGSRPCTPSGSAPGTPPARSPSAPTTLSTEQLLGGAAEHGPLEPGSTCPSPAGEASARAGGSHPRWGRVASSHEWECSPA